MTPKNRKALSDRVTRAAEAALVARQVVTAIDVMTGIGWLDPVAVQRWRLGQVTYLEAAIIANLSRISEAMSLFRKWAVARGLKPSETAYASRHVQSRVLRFSKSGHPGIELHYRTHWISPKLSEQKRERLAEKADKPPALAAIVPPNGDWTCHRCGAAGELQMMEEAGPACLSCAGLGDLDYLPAIDKLLTRRAKAKSARHAVVVRFSPSRGRYERLGLLVEPEALAAARQSLED